jgi:hypothetical protein
MLDDHAERRANLDNQIWSLLTLMLWQREVVESRPAARAREGAAAGPL